MYTKAGYLGAGLDLLLSLLLIATRGTSARHTFCVRVRALQKFRQAAQTQLVLVAVVSKQHTLTTFGGPKVLPECRGDGCCLDYFPLAHHLLCMCPFAIIAGHVGSIPGTHAAVSP